MQLTAVLMLPAFAARKKYEGIVHVRVQGLFMRPLFKPWHHYYRTSNIVYIYRLYDKFISLNLPALL